MRLFIGIELPKKMRSELSGALKELKIRSSGGRYVPEDNMHITLHFIGESNDLNGAAESMRQAVRGIHPFELHPVCYDFFEKGVKKTSFVSVGGNLKELGILHEALEIALSDNGFSREYKKFVPHITLGRAVEHDEITGAEMKGFEFTSSMTVSEIVLYESRRENGKLCYIPLHREKL